MCRSVRGVTLGFLFLFAPIKVLYADGNMKGNQHLQSTERFTMRQLQVSFQKAKPPKLNDLQSDWVVIKMISTEEFLSGKEGPDHVAFNEHGIRREEIPGSPLEWTLTFKKNSEGSLQLIQNQAATLASTVNISSEGEFVFDASVFYGSDSVYEFRCKAIDSLRLVCLLKGAEDGSGLEFMKIMNKEKLMDPR